ncbi:MAG: methyl-accepting chemotaxis protein [Proteobacteria bacterium]|nr:methyl-accepting chemotaxis protein [Pseudomonadota bacterium]
MKLFRRSSIKVKIVFLAVVMLIIAMGIPTIVSFINTREAIIEATIKESEQITSITSKNLEQWIDMRKKDVQKLGESKVFASSLGDSFLARSSRKKAVEELDQEIENSPYYLGISILNNSGESVVTSGNKESGLKDQELVNNVLSGETLVSDLTYSEQAESAVFTVISPIKSSGNPLGIILAEISLGPFAKKFIEDIKIGKSGFLYVVNKAGQVLVHPDEDYVNSQNISEFNWEENTFEDGILKNDYTWKGQAKTDIIIQIPLLEWLVVTSVEQADMIAPAQKTTYLNLAISIVILILVGLITLYLGSKITNPLLKADIIMSRFRDGDFSVRMNHQSDDEIGRVGASIDDLAKDLQSAIDDINTVMRQVANGDLTTRIQVQLKGDLNDLKHNINSSVELLEEALVDVISTSGQVNISAQELSSSAQSLANGTTQQAASLEETSSSMSEVEMRARRNTENADQAKQLTKTMSEVVDRGDSQMGEMLESMNHINRTSTEISKIIKVIDEIAFQTNLLALNAAVEAARAGKYGKGFAVVAEEVRNLAARSAEAAKNTTELIENSVKEVEKGVIRADKTAEVLKQVKESVSKVDDMVSDIAAASEEQKKGIEEINNGIVQINNVVQQNSSISEETASSSDELSNQANQLDSIVSKFLITKSMENKKVEISLDSTDDEFYPALP